MCLFSILTQQLKPNKMSQKWNFDGAHSELKFKVKHMMIATVTGGFDQLNVEVESTDDSFTSGEVTLKAATSSINTGSADRDNHLKSADFFNAEEFPEITFKSTQFNAGELVGNLTIKGITKEIKLDVDFGGLGKDPWGNTKAGFSVSGKINRKDFGLEWNVALETGGILVGEDVKFEAEIQLAKA
jgi:polyisoprenoid-binding protein YceI